MGHSKKKPKKVKTAETVAFNRARGRITSSGNLLAGLADYKVTADPAEIRRVVPQLLAHKGYNRLIWRDPTPHSLASVATVGIPGYADVYREVEWAVQTLIPHAGLINTFLSLKNKSDLALLMGRYDEFDQIIGEIKNKFGYSIWLIESNINYKQLREGLTKQKEYAQTIFSEKALSSLIKYIISWLSFRSEKNVSAPEFLKALDDAVPDTSGIAILTHIISGNCISLDVTKAGHALAYTDLFPLVDRYLGLLSVVQAFAASAKDAAELTPLAAPLRLLRQQVEDPSLDRLALVCGVSVELIDADNVTGVLDAYSVGDYRTAMTVAGDMIKERGGIDALQLYLRGSATGDYEDTLTLPTDSLIAKIAGDLRRVINFESDAQEGASRLTKLALIYSNMGWAASLALTCSRQRNDERIYLPTRQQTYEALRSGEDNPILAFSLNGAGENYLDAIGRSFPDSVTCRAARGLLKRTSDGIGGLAEPHRMKVEAALALRSDDPEKAISLLSPFYDAQPFGFRKIEAGLHLAEALLRADKLHECCERCAELFLHLPYLGTLLPIKQLVRSLVRAEEISPRFDYFLGHLPVVIVFDIYSRFFSANRDPERADAFRDFLTANGVEHASQLIDKYAQFPREQLIYFLRNVSVPNVLDQSLALKTSHQVEEERATILVQLNELISSAGDTPPPELSEELQEIRTRQVIRDTTLQLDQSKIYVDVDGIRKSLGAQLKEGWNRYKLLSIQQDAGDTTEDMVKAIQDRVGTKFTVLSLALPLTERNKLFERMVGEIRDLFASSKVFGLDANLSTNIRHGFILRELRKPFLASHLVTNRATQSSEYQPNEYWLGRVTGDTDDYAPLSSALNSLSEKVDTEIERVIGSMLRIRSEQMPEGLFDFRITDLELQLIQKRAENQETYEEFLDQVFAYLWSKTEKNLDGVRNALMSETLHRLQNALTDLQEQLEACCSDKDIVGLTQAINLSRPEVRSAVERVANWFTLSGSREYQDYPLKIAFDAAVATVASYPSAVGIKSTFAAPDDLMMAGWTLPYVTRLFTLAVENASVHSGFSAGNVEVACEASLTPGYLDIRISNQLSDDLDHSSLQSRVNTLNSEFGRDAASEFVRREGKSGYPKIWKILTHDLRREHELSVELTDEKFIVEILMNTEGITL